MSESAPERRRAPRERLLGEGLERAHLEAVMREMPVGVAIVEAPTGKLLFANGEVARIWRRETPPTPDFAAYAEWRGMHPDGRELEPGEWPAARALAHGVAVPHEEIDIVRGDGSRGTISVAAAPLAGADGTILGVVVTMSDITDRKRAEEGQRFLAGASAVLDASLDLASTLHAVARLPLPFLADSCTVNVIHRGWGARERFVSAAIDPALEQTFRELRTRYPVQPRGTHPVARAIRTGRSEIVATPNDEFFASFAEDEEHLQMLLGTKAASGMVVPLRSRGETIGAITFRTHASRRNYGQEDLALAEDFTRRVALALDNSRLYEREHRVAETLQRSLLPPRLPELPGLALAARYVPGSAGVDVGGDWYDVIPLSSAPGGEAGALGLVIGDVMGRGVRAASVMGQMRNALRVYALEGHPPAIALERLNRLVQGLEQGDMATLTYLIFWPDSGTLRFASAGHPPPLVLAADGSSRYLEDGRSVPIGVLSDARYEEAGATLSPGETLLLYTDGLVEERTTPIDVGFARLREAAESAPEDLDALCDQIVTDVLGAEKRGDDVALLAFRPLTLASERLELRLPAEPDQLAAVRRTLRSWLRQARAEPEEAAFITIACSEAVANAVEHAYGPASADFLVEAGLSDGDVEIVVRDFGSWRERRDDDRGRGLQLIRALMDSVDVRPADGGTEVRMRRRLGQKAGAA